MTIDHFDTPYMRLVALWVLRFFSKGLASHLFIQNDPYADSDIAQFLGLPMRFGTGELTEGFTDDVGNARPT